MCVAWVLVGVDEDVAVVVCKCTRNVEAFQKKNGYCILPISKQRVKCWWYAMAIVLENASALRVVYSTRSRRVQV